MTLTHEWQSINEIAMQLGCSTRQVSSLLKAYTKDIADRKKINGKLHYRLKEGVEVEEIF